ncbi:hypothetical protein [Mitsuaria sp. GD03876]|uniref:hypothetical protein n=1 Tax=Mitsuaria sp. GD03876 TaxID=2975399 RepID=UPI002446FC65|nr:hypothetical protein [Mitsuaria sp. GD03876]MDH0863235.1 hypothetical protein [Mitsuaria sp. GD03876]
MQEFGPAWDWLPKTLVDWAQVLSAIGTCGAVIVSLWIALRRSKPELRIRTSVVVLLNGPALRIGPDPEFLNISLVNAGTLPVTVTAIGWQVRRRLWRGYENGYAHQMFGEQRFPPNPRLPLSLTHAQGSDIYLELDGKNDWRAALVHPGFFRDRFKSRRSLRRLRIAVGTSVGITCRAKPDQQVLDLIWAELQKPVQQEPDAT